LGRAGRLVRHLGAAGALPDFYSDSDSEPETVDSPPAQITEQTAEPASAMPMPNRVGALVLELQDDHWVRPHFVSACCNGSRTR
jgi:hypothetical protein